MMGISEIFNNLISLLPVSIPFHNITLCYTSLPNEIVQMILSRFGCGHKIEGVPLNELLEKYKFYSFMGFVHTLLTVYCCIIVVNSYFICTYSDKLIHLASKIPFWQPWIKNIVMKSTTTTTKYFNPIVKICFILMISNILSIYKCLCMINTYSIAPLF
jgi:hypothetical protein